MRVLLCTARTPHTDNWLDQDAKADTALKFVDVRMGARGGRTLFQVFLSTCFRIQKLIAEIVPQKPKHCCFGVGDGQRPAG